MARWQSIFGQRTPPPCCPFCRRAVAPPQSLDDPLTYEFDGGSCVCGAVYSLDPTARNGGAVLLEALVHAFGGDWEQAMAASPQTDYDDAVVTEYNSRTHRVGEAGAFGTLYFIRLKRPGEEPASRFRQ